MDLGLSDRTFVVTAASAGLGFASARCLVDEGANVVLVARRAEVLADRAAELGARAVALAGDLSDAELPQRAVATAVEHFGGIDGALVSVGGPPPGGVLDMTDDQWTDSFGSVFLPAVRMARAVCAAAADARLGFVLSTSAKVPLPGMAISNGLRPGLAMVVKQLADEIGPRGGRVFGLLPGSVATERITFLHGQGGDPDGTRARVESGIPLRRLGDPAEFGRVAAFLLSDAASYVTGVMVPVDGGSMRAL